MKHKEDKKITGIILILTAIVVIASFVVYNNAIKPKKYEEYLNLGTKYLQEGNYQEAILAFEKAIKINSKSTASRVLVSTCYIEINKIDEAINNLKEAQQIDLENEKLLIEILDIVKDIDGEIAEEILQNYIDAVGEENISDEIREIINASNEKPQIPTPNPPSGTYEQAISIKLELEKIVVGHNYYYTIDGSEPDNNSQKYTGNIEVAEDTNIKVIGYNKKGESSDILDLTYVIDSEIKNELKDMIDKAEVLHNEAIEGEEEYQYKQGSKDTLLNEIKIAQEVYNNKFVEKTIVDEGVVKLGKAISTFENNQIISFTKEMARQYAIDKYGEPFDNGFRQRFYSNGTYPGFSNSRKLYREGDKRYYNVTITEWDGIDTGLMTFTILRVYDDGTIEVEDSYKKGLN